MVAPCQLSEFHAMDRGSRFLGTSEGAIAVEAGLKKARAAPNTIARPKIGQNATCPLRVMKARAPTHRTSTTRQVMMIRRRSCRSAASPANSDRANSGRNWARPIMPSNSAACFTPMWRCRAMS